MSGHYISHRRNQKQKLLGLDGIQNLNSGLSNLTRDINGAYSSFWLRWCKLGDSDC